MTINQEINKTEIDGVNVVIEWIDPARADELLAMNTKNRRQAAACIERYASDMAEGRWVFNGAPIVIDTDGRLADGQHRLEALKASGSTLPFLVVNGVQPSAFETIDDGKKRSVGDVLGIEGFANSTCLAAVANLSLRYENYGVVHAGMKTPGSKTQQVEWASDARNQELFCAFVSTAKRVNAATRITDTSVIFTSIAFAKRYGNVDEILAFWNRVESGMADGRGAGDPAMSLRTFAMSRMRDSHKGTTRAELWVAAIFRAFISEMDGSSLKLIKFAYPVVLPELP